MSSQSILELHYFLDNDKHEIDALIRNKCEAEVLAIVKEIASVLDIEAKLLAQPPKNGGFRDYWKALGKNSSQLQVVLMAATILTTFYLTYDPEGDERAKELELLKIQELKLKIKRLEQEESRNTTKELASSVAKNLEKNLKIIKRKSNFYTHLNNEPQIKKVEFSASQNNNTPIFEGNSVDRANFRDFILNTNRLRAEEDTNAQIEIISPVLKDGNYKWKGMYKDLPISFTMTDGKFKESVLIDGLNFHAGTSIVCLLRIHRELDEVGDVKIKGYSVPTVIEILDGANPHETSQGKEFRHAKYMADNQSDMFT